MNSNSQMVQLLIPNFKLENNLHKGRLLKVQKKNNKDQERYNMNWIIGEKRERKLIQQRHKDIIENRCPDTEGNRCRTVGLFT